VIEDLRQLLEKKPELLPESREVMELLERTRQERISIASRHSDSVSADKTRAG
jgi:hypothetical protein